MFNIRLAPGVVRVHSLASGSSGNAMLVQAGKTNVLVDAGLSVTRLASGLSRCGVGVADLHAILLTHEHTDHTQGADPLARRSGAPLVSSPGTLAAYAARVSGAIEGQEICPGETMTIGAVEIRPFLVSHDAAQPVGYVLEAMGARIAYFTDSGCVTEAMLRALDGADLAIVEANHDSEWLRRGPYSAEMKRRVASGTGHLSNTACADMLACRLAEGDAMDIWLAHLSRCNNSPWLARRAVEVALSSRTDTPFTLDVALRDHPSLTWRSDTLRVGLPGKIASKLPGEIASKETNI